MGVYIFVVNALHTQQKNCCIVQVTVDSVLTQDLHQQRVRIGLEMLNVFLQNLEQKVNLSFAPGLEEESLVISKNKKPHT